MAKTYYGYKKREGLKPIDYLGATKDLTEGLTGIFEEREKERGLIEEEIREAEKQTKDVPMGDSSTLNEAVLDSSSGAAEALRAQTQLMRNGIIKPSEFTKFKQNVMDGMVDLKEGAVSLNKHITETSAAVEAGTASVAQAKFLEDAMQDTWFDRTRMYTDPKSGHMMIVRTDEKGKDIKGSENSVRNFKNQTKQIIARYDIEKETSSFTKTLGEDIRLSMKSGVKTVKDALSKKTIDPVTKKEYTGFDLVNKYVDGASDADLASILVDELSGNYSPTGDVNDKGKAGMVYYEADPTAVNKNSRVPKLTPEQRDAAREYLRANIYAQIDYSETAATPKSPSSADIKASEGRKVGVKGINTLADWYSAKTPEERKVAAAGLASSLGDDFVSLTPSDDGKTATLTMIQEVNNKSVKVDIPITMEGVSFDKFIKDFGQALTGQDVSPYYQDFVKDGRTVEFSPIDTNISYGDGAYKKTFQKPPKNLKQTLADVGDWRANVVKTIDDIDVGTGVMGVGGESNEEVNDSFEGAISDNLFAAGISDFMVSRTGNNITIKVEGLGEIKVAVGRTKNDKAKVKKVLSDVYTRVSKGEKIDGSGMPDEDDGELD